MKIGVLASGSGTNLQALIDAQAAGRLGPATLAVVGVNVPGCGALERASRAGIPTFVLDHRQFPSRAAFDEALVQALKQQGVQLIALAGFMRLLTATFLDAFPGRIINIHPALLPAFPGVHAQKQAFDYGVKVSGCTVHFVDSGTDTGPIIAQAVVPVLDGDTAQTLQQRILGEEHRLFPAVIKAFAEGRVVLQGRRVQIVGAAATETRLRTFEA